MKNIKTIMIIAACLLTITSCSDDETNNTNVETNTPTNNLEQKEPKVEQVKSENKVYDKIVDNEKGLLEATSDELDAILQEEIRLLNTPTSEYVFFEQASTKKATIEEIIQSGGMEITKGMIYLNGIKEDYSFINEQLSETEKQYSFNQEGSDNTFFYLDGDSKDFLLKIKTNFEDYKIVNNDSEYMEVSFTKEGKEYSLSISKVTQSVRDDMDNILGTTNKARVSIFSLEPLELLSE